MNFIINFIYATIAASGFAVIFNVPRKSIFFAGLTGGSGWIIYYIIQYNYGNVIIATFIASIFLALIGLKFSKWRKQPFTVFVIPGIVPLVPGLGLYNTMVSILNENYEQALEIGSSALFIALAISGGLSVTISINQFLRSLNISSKYKKAKTREYFIRKKAKK